jgi:hypothetical protein
VLDLHLRLRGGDSDSGSTAAARGAARTAAPAGPATSPELGGVLGQMMGLLVNDVVAYDRGEEVLAKVQRPDLALPGPDRKPPGARLTRAAAAGR